MFKGIDDLLAAGQEPRRLTGGDVPEFFASIRNRMHSVEPTLATPPAEIPVVTQPRPLPDSRLAFPVEVFPTKVAKFARRVATAMGCPEDFPGLAVLVISGASIGAARSVQVKGGWYEKPGMYAVIVSKPGTTKTPALRAIMAPIYEEQDLLYQSHKEAVRKYEDAQKAYDAADKSETAPAKPVPPAPLRHLFASDTTVEELANNLQENRKGILLFRDELTAWVRSLDQYKGKGTDRQFFLSAWTGEMVKVDRKAAHGKPIIVAQPYISVLGGIQPDLLFELEAEEGREDGFIHRILFSYPPETEFKVWSNEEISEEDQMDWRLVLQRMLNLETIKPEGGSERPRVIHMSGEARQAYVAWHDRLVAEMNHADFLPELHGPFAKMKSYCLRFALVIHMLRVACDEIAGGQGEGFIDAEDIARAVKLCGYFQSHTRHVYARLQHTKEDDKVQRLVAWMRKKKLAKCSVRDICRAGLCGIKKASEAMKLLVAAVDRGFGQTDGGNVKHMVKDTGFVLKSESLSLPDKPDNPTAA